MPRRSTNATEKAAESPVVERRSTRSSTRKSVESSNVTSPEKQQVGDKSKTSPVKASPSQSGSKRGRPSKVQSNSTVDDSEQKADEGKLDVAHENVEADVAGNKLQEEATTEPSESAASEVPVKSPGKDEGVKATETSGEEAGKLEESAAESKKRPRDEETEESSVKKLRSDEVSAEDGADKSEELSKPATASDETPAEKMDVTTTDDKSDNAAAPVEAAEENKASEQTESKNSESETGVGSNGASETPASDATVTETVEDIPATKKAITSDLETAEEVDGALKQNGCHETAEVAAADGC